MPITLRVQTYRNETLAQPLVKRLDQLGGAIGRAVGNELVLEDASKYISRVHARIDFHDAAYYLSDVGSNPSLINDRPLGRGRQMLLADGDKLNIGEYQLQVSVSPDVAALPPSPLQLERAAPPDPFAQLENFGDSLSGASVLDVGLGLGNYDPFAVGVGASFDPFGVTPPAAFRGTQSDHVSPEMFAFQMPASAPAVRAAAPNPGHMSIPDDYDPLADFLPPRLSAVPAAPPANPPVLPAAPPALPARIESVAPFQAQAGAGAFPAWEPAVPAAAADAPAPSSPPLATASAFPAWEPAPARAPAPPPPAAARAAPAPRQAQAAPDGEVIEALLRGLGMSDLKTSRSPAELAELAGAMLREATIGTMGVLMARAVTKRESRLEMTMMASQANNPLKFFPDADRALVQMLSSSHPGYMAPARAYVNAYDDLKAHELAILAGMSAALSGVLQRFDPAAIEQRLQVPSVMDKLLAANRKAKMWDRLVELYKEITNDADADFQRLFGEKFGVAYEEQIQRLRQGRQ